MEAVLTPLIKVVVILFGVVLPGASGGVYLERRLSAFIQNRLGPNRVGPFGLLQPIADVVKLLLKEDIVPANAHKGFHFLAPLTTLVVAVMSFAIIPFGDYIIIGDLRIDLAIIPHMNAGLLYFLAVTSIAVYGLTLAGWSSNNKYSLLGGLRSASQMISYELSLGLAVIGVLMLSGTMDLAGIVREQATMWNVVWQPLAFIIFLVSSYAETNRTPFDLPEAEPELVGGYHTEYSGMKFGLFFLAEYAAMFAASMLLTVLFLGGWHLPLLGWELPIIGQIPTLSELTNIPENSIWMGLINIGTFTAKVGALVFLYVWVRWSIPRFRYDQLMNLGWKVLLPLALANIAITGIVMLLLK